MLRAFLFVTCLLSIASASAAEPDFARYERELTANLHEAIVPFWLDRSIDTEHGGYHINHSENGTPNGKMSKGIVTQARMVWFWSRMARSDLRGPGLTRQDYLQRATHGYEFLRDRMWDHEHGGFYWEVDQAGADAIRPSKHLYGQSFGLYALAEYAAASGNREAIDLLVSFQRLLDEKARDTENGGYNEFFLPDWSPVPAGEASYMGGGQPGMKLMNTHLHLMEAYTAALDALNSFVRDNPMPSGTTPTPADLRLRESPAHVAARLQQLIRIEANAVVRADRGFCTDKYKSDWTPILDPPHNQVSYGHDLENVWLLMEANRAVKQPDAPFHDLYRALWDYSIEYGYDQDAGGFWYTGPFDAEATNKSKSWWVQAEVLVSALRMYEITGDPRYWDVFEKTWTLVRDKMTDREVGGWHSRIGEDGRPGGDKANIWKSAYHNGRAMIEGVAALRRLQASR